MNRNPSQSSLLASPVIIGAITTLITSVAVFLAYNANQGLPFVPTYHVTVQLPDALGLRRGNEVRIGGARVGLISQVTAKPTRSGPVALVATNLDKTVEPLHLNTRARVRPRSPLGLKYLELIPANRGPAIADHGTLPVGHALPAVDLDQVLNAFDASTRQSLDESLTGLGDGLAGRGVTFNAVLADAPRLLTHLRSVAANLADPRTDITGAIDGLDRTVSQLAPVAPQLGGLVTGASATAGALASVHGDIEQGLAGLPPTESIGTASLAATRPVLHGARLLLRDLRPGTRVLAAAAAQLHSALVTGIPIVRRLPPLTDRLRSTLSAVARLSADPLTSDALVRLHATERVGLPTLRFVSPMQTTCNYLGLWARNISSALSEGDASGTWLRTLVIFSNTQQPARATPAPDLHVNPYPNSAAPGETHECEAGNEPYLPGQRFGNTPGNQGLRTEGTSPPAGVGR